MPFQSCMCLSKEWNTRLEKGLELLLQLQSVAKPVEDWVSEVHRVLQMEDDSDGVLALTITVGTL